eukprot:COSAG06_NODE_42193_length_384_cov_0.649123_1_plen_96_part_10
MFRICKPVLQDYKAASIVAQKDWLGTGGREALELSKKAEKHAATAEGAVEAIWNDIDTDANGRLNHRELRLLIFFKQKTAYEIMSGDWSSDVCSSD